MAKSCVLITGEELQSTKEKCFEVSIEKANKALTFPQVYQAKPFNLKILKQDVDKYINSDEEYQRAYQKVRYLETVVDFLDRTVRQISNRGFVIKNAIDWRKFTSGAI